MPSPAYNHLNKAIHIVKHFVGAQNEHGIHSPFVFRMLTESIYDKSRDPAFAQIENFRKTLLQDNREIAVTDLGAGSSYDGKLKTRSIREICSKFAKSPKHCRFLFHLTRFLQPSVMIELGTSLGISAMYQSAGFSSGNLYTLEGCPETAKVATENFKTNRIENISCITGNFDDTLPNLLNKLKITDYVYIDGNHTYEATLRYFHLVKKHVHEKSVIVFDDIYWSEPMQKAWQEIMGDSSVTISLDFYQFGVVFFNPGFTKQRFKLRL